MRRLSVSVFLVLLLLASCQQDNTVKIDRISVYCAEERGVFDDEMRYYYSYSTSGKVITLGARCYDEAGNAVSDRKIEWSIADPLGNISSPLDYRNSIGSQAFTVNGDFSQTLGIIISSLDLLGEWKITASASDKSSTYSFTIDSQNDISSSLCIDYSSLDMQNMKIRRNANSLSNLPTSIKLSKDKFYYIGFLQDNNLGELAWQTDNASALELFDQDMNPLAFPFSTPSNIKGVYAYTKSLCDGMSLRIKAGAMYEKEVSLSISEQTIDNTIAPPEISFQAIEGGYAVVIAVDGEITNESHTLFYRTAPDKEYMPAMIEDGVFRTEIKSQGHYSFNAYLSSNTSDEKSAETGERELTISYPPIPETITITSRDIPASAPTTRTFYDSKHIKEIAISISSLPQTNVYENAKIVFVNPQNEETVIEKDDIPYSKSFYLNSPGTYDYHFYFRNLKGYADISNSSLSLSKESVKSHQVSIPRDDLNITYKYESTSGSSSKYTISVKENTPSYDWTLYYQYSMNAGGSWSAPMALSKSQVLNKSYIIKNSSGNDVLFPTGSSSCIIRSKIIATGHEDIYSAETPLSRLLSATPCTVDWDDSVQRYYNAREVKWVRSYSTDRIYYQIVSSSQYFDDGAWIESKTESGNTGYIRLNKSVTPNENGFAIWIKTVDKNSNISIKKYSGISFTVLPAPELELSGAYGFLGACRNISVKAYADAGKYNNPIIVFSGRCDEPDGDEVGDGVVTLRSSDGETDYLAYCPLSTSDKELLYDGMIWAAGPGFAKGFARSKGYIDSPYKTSGEYSACTVNWSTIYRVVSNKLI